MHIKHNQQNIISILSNILISYSFQNLYKHKYLQISKELLKSIIDIIRLCLKFFPIFSLKSDKKTCSRLEKFRKTKVSLLEKDPL